MPAIPVRTSTPPATKAASTAALTSRSAAGSTRSASSSSVTATPNPLNTVASWEPVAPLPMIATEAGRRSRSTIRSATVVSSMPSMGSRRELPPVAMTNAAPRRRRPEPPSSIVCGSANRAQPSVIRRTPAASSCPAMSFALCTCSIAARTRAAVRAHTRCAAGTSTPKSPAERASRSTRAVRASNRVGTQPVFTQVPPTRAASTRTVRAPSWAARTAALTPAGPAPITTTS